MRFDTKDGDVNIRVKFEPRDIWFGIYWNLHKSIESQYRKLDVYICLIPTLPIHIQYVWGLKNQDKDYNAYCYNMWTCGIYPKGYRQWKRDRQS